MPMQLWPRYRLPVVNNIPAYYTQSRFRSLLYFVWFLLVRVFFSVCLFSSASLTSHITFYIYCNAITRTMSCPFRQCLHWTYILPQLLCSSLRIHLFFSVDFFILHFSAVLGSHRLRALLLFLYIHFHTLTNALDDCIANTFCFFFYLLLLTRTGSVSISWSFHSFFFPLNYGNIITSTETYQTEKKEIV